MTQLTMEALITAEPGTTEEKNDSSQKLPGSLTGSQQHCTPFSAAPVIFGG
jgi:hypothetical protein